MTPITRRSFLGNALAAGAAASALGGAGALAHAQETAAQGAAAPQARPNFLILLTDDQRYDALGCMGNEIIQTPVMDELARQGTLFRNAFVTTPICCTSRASIFTGMYARTHGVHDFSTPLRPEHHAVSYPVMLHDAGYHTGFVGKYGVGSGPQPGAFDFFYGLPGNGRYLQEVDGETRHMTAMLRDAAVEYLSERTPDEPFCLSVSFRAPHAEDYDPRPFPPDPSLEDLYEDAYIPPPELASDDWYDALPEFLKETEGRVRWRNRYITPERYQESMRDMYRMITGIDRAIGRMLETMADAGVLDNTVVILLSDNGTFFGDRGLADKWYAYEASIRVPMIIHDPRNPRGNEATPMALNIDVAPTVLSMAGIPAPDPVQGRDLTPLLAGERPPWREDWYFEHLFEHPGIPRSEGVRTERWKYFRWLDQDPMPEELYDLRADPLEKQNLADDPAHADNLASMRALLQSYRDRLPEAPVQAEADSPDD